MNYKNGLSLLLSLFTSMVFLQGCMGNKLRYRALTECIPSGDTILIRNVDIFNGIDSTLVRNQDVWIENGKIAGVGKAGIYKRMPRTVIDGTGKFLIPGFVDSHVHITASGSVPWQKAAPDMRHNLDAYLYAGVTTVFDLGGLPGDVKKGQDKVNSGEWNGPKIYMAGSPITAAGSHPIPLIKVFLPWPLGGIAVNFVSQCDDPSKAAEVIETKMKINPDYIKLICDQLPPGSPEMKDDVLAALIQAAHAKNKKVFVHIGDGREAMAAVRSGADVLAHIPYRGGISENDCKEIASRNVKIIFTLAGFQGVADMCDGKYQPSLMEKNTADPFILDPATGESGKTFCGQPVLGGFAQAAHDHSGEWQNIIQMLDKAGVQFLIGTDSPIPGSYEGGGFHREMQLLHKAGISNAKLLIAATSAAAKTILSEPDFGIIQPGKRADLILLKANPLDDIGNSEKIEWVMKAGRMFGWTK